MRTWSVAALLAVPTWALAHGEEAHVKGVVVEVGATKLTLDAGGGRLATVSLDASTKYERAGAPATGKDVVPGVRVVVHLAPARKGEPPVAALVKVAPARAPPAPEHPEHPEHQHH